MDQIDRVFNWSGIISIRNRITGHTVMIDNNEDFDKVKHGSQSFKFYLYAMFDPSLILL